jgi:hypothetical protein
MACPPGKKMAILKAVVATRCSSDVQEAALIMTAQTMMEIRNQTRIPGSDPLDPETITTEALALAEIGKGMADGHTYAEPLDATIRSLLEMAVSYVMPRREAEKEHQHAETNGLTVVVETSSEREQRDKYITVGGLKLWRNSEPPHTAFYAHHWVGPGKTFEAWRVEWDRFCGETTLIPRYQHRNDATERALRSWFAWVADLAKPEQLTAAQVRQFQAFIDLQLEAYLLRKSSVMINQGLATASLAASLEKRRHDARVLDYHTDLVEARNAGKLSQTTKASPSQNSRSH